MKKFVLAFVLSILFISFAAFLYNTYVLQKNYFNQKNTIPPTTEENQITKVDTPSKYISYTKDEYDKALSENRVIILFFTSNWCTACINQDSINKTVFNDLNKEGVVGLNVHILDSETTTETDALSKKFDVTKENTFIFLDKKGAVNLKYTGELTKEELEADIMKVGDTK